MLLEKSCSVLLLVDVQEKLAPYVTHSEAVVNRCHWLMRLATKLNVPILTSEQYPSGLGKTVAPLDELVDQTQHAAKVHFSCYSDAGFLSHWQALNNSQAVIAGIETHVCVLQTALELREAGVSVFVVVDAVSSRHELDHRYGLKRMKQQGIHLVTAEMVFFEWLRQAGTPEFKALSQAFLR